MKTILIVDDEPVLRNLLVLYITAAGYRALEAATGAEAIRLANYLADDIDLAIIDQTLEDRKGSELEAELATIRPGMRALMISGAPEDDTAAGVTGQRSVSFLQKPFSREALLDRIRELLAARHAGGAGSP